MRLLAAMVLASFALASTARADFYPHSVVDRPLVLLPDMTEADAGVDFPTYRTGLTGHTALGDYRNLDVGLHHAFGPVQLGITFNDDFAGPVVDAGPRMMLGPGALDIDLSMRVPTDASGIDQELGQEVRYTGKTIVMPGALALYANAAVAADEISSVYTSEMDGLRIAGRAGAGADVQLVPDLAAVVGASVTLPIAGLPNAHAYPAIGGQLIYVIDRFDAYAGVSVSDLFKGPMPYASVGVVARFGG